MENASYKNPEPANAYDKSWNYSDKAVARLCEIISINHKETSQESRHINILDIGIGTGSLSVKITERLSREGNKVLLHGFDISEHMIQLCKQRAEDCSLKDSVKLARHDASDITEIPDFIKNTKYDVIIITFVLHYLDGKPGNPEGLDFKWKEIIEHYSGKLRDKGLLIQAEVIGDMVAVDGLTPVDDKSSNREFARVWERYFHHRRDMGKEWKPNIRPSSYYNVFKWINKDNSKLRLWQYAGFTCKHEQIVSATVIEDWIKTGQFSSLSVELKPDQRQSLAEMIKQEINGKDYPITLDCRFVIHQKTGPNNDFFANRFASFCEYKRKADQVSFLPLKDNRLPIKGNKLDPEIDCVKEIVDSLNQFLEECILPLSSCTFLDCELTIYDFIRNESAKTDWASVAIVRPEFFDRRKSYTKEISGSKSFIEIIYEGQIIKAGTIVRIKLTSESAKMEIRDKEGKWKALEGSRTETESKDLNDGINFHKSLSSDPKQDIYTYYITTLFANGIGIGGIILVTETEIDDRLLELVQIFASDVVNPIGASYLKEEHKRQIGLSSRAAVFARNFSHITGSHVISNPEFRNSLAGQHMVHSLRRRLDESYVEFVRSENNLLKYITQRPDQAENLWEQGARSLADARDKLSSGGVLVENTRRFHEYLQGRFDFIARAIDDTKDSPEPVWFVKDLIEGFLCQTAYLDNFVADVGLRLENMEFHVRVEDDEYIARWVHLDKDGDKPLDSRTSEVPFEIEWKRADGNEKQDTNSGQVVDFDCMIALPGGMVAAHAFYSLLENIIRNSAKYGKLKKYQNNYKLTIELGRPTKSNSGVKEPSFYYIRIWDNYSSALFIDEEGKANIERDDSGNPVYKTFEGRDQPWRDLQQRLEKTYVKDKGQPETEDLGMMEMQSSSQLLCLPDNDGMYAWPNHENAPNGESKKYNLRIVPPTAKNGQASLPEQDWHLLYELNIAIPILLGCLTDKCPGRKTLTFFSDEIEKLRDQAPFLLVIDGEWLINTEKVVREGIERMLSEDRHTLPTRILVLYRTPSNKLQTIEDRLVVSISGDDDMYTSLIVNRDNEENMVLDAYRAWLLKWKPGPDEEAWDLWIGLDRQGSQVREAWGHADGFMDEKSKKLVRLLVKSSSPEFHTESAAIYCKGEPEVTNKAATEYWNEEFQREFREKKALLFDNHGNCFSQASEAEKTNALRSSTRFYQKLSGSVSPDLFRMLSRPPKSRFSFLFFIYSLVESCLTNVAVFDERLAWSLVEAGQINQSNPNFASDLADHQKAGIFPIFRFRQILPEKSNHRDPSEIGYYNEKHRQKLLSCLSIQSNEKDLECMINEGIVFDVDKAKNTLQILTIQQHADKLHFETTKTPIDVILIHEGAMDILTSEMSVAWEKVDNKVTHQKQLKALYQLAPIIARTSGRGRKSKFLGEHLPFIEFGQVSSSLLTARNKFALVRGLLGSVGTFYGRLS